MAGFHAGRASGFQSARFGRYTEVAQALLAGGHAYRCECTSVQLDAIRAICEKEKRPFRYPGTCRDKNNSRGKLGGASEGSDERESYLWGFDTRIDYFQNKDMDDWVILRTGWNPDL